MSKHPTPTAENRAAAAEMLPRYAAALVTARVETLQSFRAVSASESASPRRGLDAYAEMRARLAAAAKAEADYLGVLVLGGMARTAVAAVVGSRVDVLAARLVGTPASWAGMELVRDHEALPGGWRPA